VPYFIAPDLQTTTWEESEIPPQAEIWTYDSPFVRIRPPILTPMVNQSAEAAQSLWAEPSFVSTTASSEAAAAAAAAMTSSSFVPRVDNYYGTHHLTEPIRSAGASSTKQHPRSPVEPDVSKQRKSETRWDVGPQVNTDSSFPLSSRAPVTSSASKPGESNRLSERGASDRAVMGRITSTQQTRRTAFVTAGNFPGPTQTYHFRFQDCADGYIPNLHDIVQFDIEQSSIGKRAINVSLMS